MFVERQAELPGALAGWKPEGGRAVFSFSNMGWVSLLKGFWWRHQKVRRVNRLVRRQLPHHLPGAQAGWTIIAENHPHDCVLYVAYTLADQPGFNHHRYFRVTYTDWSVTMLDEGYRPERWGPYL